MIKELPTRDATGRGKRTNKHMTFFFTNTEILRPQNVILREICSWESSNIQLKPCSYEILYHGSCKRKRIYRMKVFIKNINLTIAESESEK